MNIHFAQPLWLTAGLLICLAAVFFIRMNIVRRKKELHRFAAPHLSAALTRNVSASRRQIKNILLVLGLACLFIALARPQYGSRWVEVKQKGIDILIAFDVSKSMLARDVKPDRMERAKFAVRDFAARLNGDRIGLLPFAGSAFLMCPLTSDYDAFDNSLNALDVNIIPKGGTNIGAAIREAEKILKNEANHKILILVTDGEDLSDDAIRAAKEAKQHKMTIYTIGVGTPEGELIPTGTKGGKEFVQDASGKFITSKLDEKTLTRIAEITGGLYVPLGNMGQGFETIYQQKLKLVPREEHDQRKRKVPIERFPWPLGAAVLLLSADFLITGRKSSWALRIPFVRTVGRRTRKEALVTILVLLAGCCGSPARASEGEELFHNGKFEQAVEYYQQELKKNPHQPVLQYNLGDAAYGKKDYEQAAESFTRALESDDLKLQEKSYYNRGNAQYYLGSAAQKTDPEHTAKLWQDAVNSYQAALKLSPDDKQAAHNLEVVKKRLEQLQQQQQQKQKKKQNNQENKEQQQKNKKKNNQDKGKKDGTQQKSDNKKKQQHDKGDKQDQQSGNNTSNQDNGKKNSPGQQKNAQQPNPDQKQQADNGQNSNKDNRKKEESTAQNGGNKKSPPNDKQQPGGNNDSALKNGRPGQMSRQDLERRKQGKMTAEEAANLLNSLKGEQKELNFIPQGNATSDTTDNRDW